MSPAAATRFDRPSPALLEDLPDLFTTIPEPVELDRIDPPPDSIQAAFEQFREANPWVEEALVELTRDLLSRGRKKVGIGMLFEILRWHWQRTVTDQASAFRLNNNYRSRYARYLEEKYPDFVDVFEKRALHAR